MVGYILEKQEYMENYLTEPDTWDYGASKEKTGYSRETKDPLTMAQQQKFMNFTANDLVHVKYVPLFTFYLGTG